MIVTSFIDLEETEIAEQREREREGEKMVLQHQLLTSVTQFKLN